MVTSDPATYSSSATNLGDVRFSPTADASRLSTLGWVLFGHVQFGRGRIDLGHGVGKLTFVDRGNGGTLTIYMVFEGRQGTSTATTGARRRCSAPLRPVRQRGQHSSAAYFWTGHRASLELIKSTHIYTLPHSLRASTGRKDHHQRY